MGSEKQPSVEKLKKKKQVLQMKVMKLRDERKQVTAELNRAHSTKYIDAMNQYVSLNKKIDKIRDDISAINKQLTTKETYKSWRESYLS